MLSTVEATKSLIKAAEFQAQRLQSLLAEFQARNEASLKFLKTAREPDQTPGIKAKLASSHNPHIWHERADQACALAEETGDPVTKQLLLEMAKSYEEMAR